MTQHPELDPGKYARAIAASPAYVAERTRFAQKAPEGDAIFQDPSDTIKARRMAISMGAASLTHTEKEGFNGFDRAVFDVISQLGTVVDTVRTLAELRERGARHVEKDPYTRKMIQFNHSLRAIIDHRPSIRYHDLAHLLENAYKPMSDPSTDDREIFKSELHQSLNGVRHEIGFEQIVGAHHEIKEETSIDDDARGDDLEVLVDGIWVPIDVKASWTKMQETRARKMSEQMNGHHATTNNPHLVIWSHLSDEDFGDSFMISPRVAEHKYAEIAPLLHKAAQSIKKVA